MAVRAAVLAFMVKGVLMLKVGRGSRGRRTGGTGRTAVVRTVEGRGRRAMVTMRARSVMGRRGRRRRRRTAVVSVRSVKGRRGRRRRRTVVVVRRSMRRLVKRRGRRAVVRSSRGRLRGIFRGSVGRTLGRGRQAVAEARRRRTRRRGLGVVPLGVVAAMPGEGEAWARGGRTVGTTAVVVAFSSASGASGVTALAVETWAATAADAVHESVDYALQGVTGAEAAVAGREDAVILCEARLLLVDGVLQGMELVAHALEVVKLRQDLLVELGVVLGAVLGVVRAAVIVVVAGAVVRRALSLLAGVVIRVVTNMVVRRRGEWRILEESILVVTRAGRVSLELGERLGGRRWVDVRSANVAGDFDDGCRGGLAEAGDEGEVGGEGAAGEGLEGEAEELLVASAGCGPGGDEG